MATLNITYNGRSADYPLEIDCALGDDDVRRIAIEVVRAGGIEALIVPDLPEDAFANYVIDRLGQAEAERIYLRPKVPFGAIWSPPAGAHTCVLTATTVDGTPPPPCPGCFKAFRASVLAADKPRPLHL